MGWKDKLERGDVVLVDFSQGTVGAEKQGIRPAVVLSNTMMNRESPNILLAPMTSAEHKQNRYTGRYVLLPTHVYLSTDYYSFLYKSSILQLEDMRSGSKLRVLKYLGKLSSESLSIIDKKLTTMMLG